MSKVVFKTVSMKNFMAFGAVPTVVQLDSAQTWGIIGENRDVGTEGNSRNGVGKTTMFAGIIYAAYGKSIDKLKADDFINITNGNKLVVELTFSKDGVEYTITRGRKPNYLEFIATKNGEEVNLTMDSMANTDKEIEKILEMSYDVFMTTVFLSPHRESFMEMSTPMQRSTIEQMLSLDVLSERAEAIKVIRDDINVDIRVKERELEMNAEKIEQWEARKARLISSSETWDINNTEEISENIEKLSKLEEVPVGEISELLMEIAKKKAALTVSELELVNIKSVIKESERHNSRFKEIEADILEFSELQKKEDEHRAEQIKKITSELDEIGDVSSFQSFIDGYESLVKLEDSLASVDRDTVTITTQDEVSTREIGRLVEEIEGIENGKCHVCGGHYEDEAKLKKCRDSLEKLEKQRATDRETLTELAESRSKLDKELASIDGVVRELTKSDVADLRAAITRVETLTRRKEDIERNPSRDYKHDIIVQQERLGELGELIPQAEIDEAIEKSGEIEKSVESGTKKVSEISNKLNEYGITTERQLNDVTSQIKTTTSMLEKLKSVKNPHVDELKHVEKEKPESDVTLASDLEKLKTRATHAVYLIKLLTDSKSFIRRGILDRYIPYLNKKINGYLQSIGLPHVVEVTTDLNVELIYMQKSVSYYNLSRGERLRLNIATTVAFRDLMAMIGKTNNLLLLDEVLDSALDESGIISTSALLQGSADDVFLITHRDELMATLDRKLVVIKENGFGRIHVS